MREMGSGGFSSLAREYDEDGHMTRESYYDPEGSLLFVPAKGYAALVRSPYSRARVLSIDYCTGPAQPVCTAIRRALRMETGARSVKDIARCDWQVAQEIVETWEEPQELRKIADKVKE